MYDIIMQIYCLRLSGLIKDWTNYDMYQISLLVLNGAFIVPWALQFLVEFKQWQKQRAP